MFQIRLHGPEGHRTAEARIDQTLRALRTWGIGQANLDATARLAADDATTARPARASRGSMERSSIHVLRGLPPGDEGAKEQVDGISEQLGIAASVMGDLLEMIRNQPLNTKRLQLRDVVDAAAREIHVSVEVERLADLPDIVGDPSQLRQAFVNLLQNAQEAAGDGGTVSVDVEVDPTHIALGISDTGPGVDPAILGRLFEPLVTTRQKRLGLGLALVKRIVERHGGRVLYEPRGPGARFVVRLARKSD